jgi:hypothetical protein
VRTEPPPLAPGDAVVETFPPKRRLAVAGYAAAAVVVFSILGAVAGGIYVGSAIPVVVVTPLVLLLVPLALGCIRLGTVGPALTTRRLAVPRFLRGWQTLELATVCGVGLRYHLAAQSSAGEWNLLIWLDDGTRRELEVPGPRRLGAWSTKWHDPKTEGEWRHEWDVLAESPEGRAAQHIAERVRIVQGPDGLYANRHREVTGARGQYETCYWSPDGRLGRLA